MTKLFKSIGIYSQETQPDVMYICTLLPVQLESDYFVKHIINVSTAGKNALLIVISSDLIIENMDEKAIAFGFNYSFHKNDIINQSGDRISTSLEIVDFIHVPDESFRLIAIYDYNFDSTNTTGLAYIDSTIANVKSGSAGNVNSVRGVGCCP